MRKNKFTNKAIVELSQLVSKVIGISGIYNPGDDIKTNTKFKLLSSNEMKKGKFIKYSIDGNDVSLLLNAQVTSDSNIKTTYSILKETLSNYISSQTKFSLKDLELNILGVKKI